MKTTEEWRPVPSLEGVMVSSLGRVKLPEKTGPLPNGGTRTYKTKPRYGHVTKASKGAKHVYMGISTRQFGNLKVHRLVCEAFHGPPPFEGAVVIHRDEDGTNNKKENVYWGTQKENLNADGFIEYCKSRTGDANPRRKAILASAMEND